MATIANLVVDVTAKTSGVRKALTSVKSRVSSFVGSTVKSFAKIGLALTAAFAATTAIVVNSINKTANEIDKLAKMAGTIGIATDEFQALSFAAGLAGLSLEDTGNVLKKLQKSIFDAEQGLATAKRGFDILGLSVENLKKLTPEQQFLAVSDAMKNVKDQTTLAGLSMDLLGRGGFKALNLIKSNVRGVTDEFKSYDLALTESQKSAVETFNDAKARLAVFGQGFKEQITANVAPAFTAIILHIRDTIKEMGGIRTIAAKVSDSMIGLAIRGVDGLTTIAEAFAYANTVGLRFDNAINNMIISLTKLRIKALEVGNIIGFVLGGEFGAVSTKAIINAEQDLFILENRAKDTEKQIKAMMDAAVSPEAAANLTRLKNSLSEVRANLGKTENVNTGDISNSIGTGNIARTMDKNRVFKSTDQFGNTSFSRNRPDKPTKSIVELRLVGNETKKLIKAEVRQEVEQATRFDRN